jgi:ATP-dependent RNA helicase RhlB
MKFKELPLHEEVMKGIEAAGFTDCMPVQEKVLPGALQGKDVMAQSKTGSGKTAVFLITLLQKFIDAREAAKQLPEDKAYTAKSPVALIVAPTRELAVQIEEDARLLSTGIPGFRIGCFYGGVGYAKQDKQIAEGVDLIIGTPGRILDYQKMGKLDFKSIDTFVIDEADRLFDMGFYPDVQKMFKLMVKKDQRQTMLFSATLGTRVRNLAWDYMNTPLEIEVQPEEITVKAITQELYHVSKDEKFDLFLRLMAKEDPSNALIFTNTKAKAVEISKRLNVNGYKTQYLMGDLPQSKRLGVINRMKSGELRFLVATDVAARGLQIDDLELVVNFDIPEDYESYVHRIGRTARAGKSGKAITLACEQFVYGLEAIENYIQMKIPVMWADEETLPKVEDKSAKMRFRDLVSESEFASRSSGGARGGRQSKSGPRRGNSSSRGPSNRNRSTAKTHGKGSPKPAAAKSAKPDTAKPIKPGKSYAESAPRQKSNTNRPKPSAKSKSYQDIQKMDFEERIAYYKKAYAEDSGAVQPAAPKNPKKSHGKASAKHSSGSAATGSRRSSNNQNPRHDKTAKQVQQGPKAPVKAKGSPDVVSAPKKKQGFLARLFKRNKGDA